MNSEKPRILLCWGYHRKGWLHAFNALEDDFEFSYLFYLEKPKVEINHTKNKNIFYWTDFSSAQNILERLKPDKIVFIGIEGINYIALNIVAKKRNIETIFLQHGLFHSYSDYLNWSIKEMEERRKTGELNMSAERVDRVFLFRFFLNSVIFTSPSAMIYMAKLQYLKRKYLEVEALKYAPSKFRTASKYVVFTKENAAIFWERDKINSERLIEVGNPEIDAYFKYQSEPKKENERYYLLIDEPWSEMKDYDSPGFGISKEQTNEFYKKLANFAAAHLAKLRIKLHPYSYESDFLLQHPNIEYLRDTDTVNLIVESLGVFSFSSTLSLPAIYFNRCCLFKIWEQSGYQDDIGELKLAQILNYHAFNEADIDFESYEKTEENIARFVKRYFYKTDGKTIWRIKEILEKDVV